MFQKKPGKEVYPGLVFLAKYEPERLNRGLPAAPPSPAIVPVFPDDGGLCFNQIVMEMAIQAGFGGQSPPPYYVYIVLCSDESHYIGCTSDLTHRLKQHNAGQVHYTRTRLPVELVVCAYFKDKYKAFTFEKYLKSGSGRAFCKRHFL